MPICLRDPTTGYGIFVENMLDAAAKCRDTPPGVSLRLCAFCCQFHRYGRYKTGRDYSLPIGFIIKACG